MLSEDHHGSVIEFLFDIALDGLQQPITSPIVSSRLLYHHVRLQPPSVLV
jgi:hypothetical protein